MWLFAVSFFEERQKMANKNALIPSETINMITAAAAQKPPVVPGSGGHVSFQKKKLLKNLEINGGARLNSWVDSMRSSSPTHHSLTNDPSSWIVRKPNQ